VSERHAVWTGALAVTAAALVLPTFMAVPRKLPATAMGSALLLYLERGLVVFAILLFLLVFLYRSLVHGELPKAISGRGAEWSDLATETTTVTDSLQKQVNALRAELEGLKEEVRTGGRLRQ
jgi:membrane protein implicated in regulation of membrane protease activity